MDIIEFENKVKSRNSTSLLKKVLKWGSIAYATAFLGTSMHVGYDHLTQNASRIEREEGLVQYLDVRRYKVKVDGDEKDLTLVGENHYYNKKENEIAQQLVKEHAFFANEVGNDVIKETPWSELAYVVALGIPYFFDNFYYCIGSGRQYSSISNIAMENGKIVHHLDNPKKPLGEINLEERLYLFAEILGGGLTSPLSYYKGKNEKPFNPKFCENWKLYDSLVRGRDKVMAENLFRLLETDGVDKLLATVGRAHLEGVISNLSKKVNLEEIK